MKHKNTVRDYLSFGMISVGTICIQYNVRLDKMQEHKRTSCNKTYLICSDLRSGLFSK